MATYLGTSAVFQVQSTATAGNINGGGFNPSNANFPTDGVIAGGTGNTPTLTPTSSYAPSASDNNAWAFFPVQTGVTYPTWAKITLGSGGVATLAAAIGQCVLIINNRYTTNTVAGISSTATPTLTYTIDYSQQDATRQSFSNLGSASGSTTLTDNSSGGLFHKAMAGNFININSGTNATAGWYEIVSVTDTNNVVLDRTPHAANVMSASVGKVGGAVSLAGSTAGITDAIFLGLSAGASTSGSRFFIKGAATYAVSAALTTVGGSSTWPVIFEGYTSVRGDRPSIASGNQPILSMGANTFTLGNYNELRSLSFKGTGAPVVSLNTGSIVINCKSLNISTTAARAAFELNNGRPVLLGSEAVSYRGIALNTNGAAGSFINCYAHDSDTGVNQQVTGLDTIGCIICSCVTAGYVENTLGNVIMGNTFYGAETPIGIGISIPFAAGLKTNNIFYGFVSGIGTADTKYASVLDNNCYYNNTANIGATTTGAFLGASDLTASNPSFTSLTQRTGSTATTTAGNHLVQSGATFVTWGITAGVDCVYISAGTGVTAGIYGILSVDSETQITADITLTANATSDKVWSITHGHNFAFTSAALKAAGMAANASGLTTGYTDIGAVQALSPNYNIFDSAVLGGG